MPQQTIGTITWIYTTYSEGVNTYASIGDGTNGGATTEGQGLSGSVTIPNTLGGFSVRIIGTNAFRLCSSLTSVSFEPNSQLETIGQYAFLQSGLTSITLPASQTSIGSYAFYLCSALTSVNFESGSQLETIGTYAFNSTGLSGSISLPASATSIGDQAFRGCSNLTSVNFESGSLTANGSSIGYRAFYQSGIATVNAYSDTIDAMGWTVSDSTDPPTYNTIGNKSGITVVDLTPPPPDPICFPQGTPVSTNLGPVAIEKLNPDKHSIRGKEIVAITQSKPLQKHIVCFEKDSLSKNVPSQQTLCSMEHKVFYKGEMIKARNIVDLCENVTFIPYNGETLFNVLLKKHDKMMINNLICETLHPENITAKISTMKDGQKKNKAIQELTKIIKENNVPEYQKLYASL